LDKFYELFLPLIKTIFLSAQVYSSALAMEPGFEDQPKDPAKLISAVKWPCYRGLFKLNFHCRPGWSGLPMPDGLLPEVVFNWGTMNIIS
jgi:hypothetical protein